MWSKLSKKKKKLQVIGVERLTYRDKKRDITGIKDLLFNQGGRV